MFSIGPVYELCVFSQLCLAHCVPLIFRKFSIQRKTMNLKVPYYVKENFHTEHHGSMRRLEMSVEEDYIQNLRQACYREKNYSKLIILHSVLCVVLCLTKPNISLSIFLFTRGNIILESKKFW